MNVITKTVSLPDGRTISIETGKVAKQCDGAEMPPLGGLYAIMETGWYSVEMTCTDMPLFMFWGEFFVSGPSAVGRLPLDGLEIGISGLRVNVGGLPEGSRAALFSAAGAQAGRFALPPPSGWFTGGCAGVCLGLLALPFFCMAGRQAACRGLSAFVAAGQFQ